MTIPRRRKPPGSKTGPSTPQRFPVPGIVHPRSLAEVVEAHLRDAIIAGELAFGRALREDETGLALGVSRTPLRTALARLETQGLVVIVPNKGVFVFEPSLATVRQLTAFRLMLETNALEQALDNAPEATLRDLSRVIVEMRAAYERHDGKAYAEADTVFHDTFFAHCGNDYVANAFKLISGQVAALRAHLSVDRAWERDTSFVEHEAIIRAFASRDRARLREILSAHILRAAEAYAGVVPDAAEPVAAR